MSSARLKDEQTLHVRLLIHRCEGGETGWDYFALNITAVKKALLKLYQDSTFLVVTFSSSFLFIFVLFVCCCFVWGGGGGGSSFFLFVLMSLLFCLFLY